ncbi:MAG: hypothetical protein AAFO78_00870 [Pseudomonadota bacterium]
MSLKKIFTDGVEFGDGIVCPTSPFSSLIILDFYDGAIEGIAHIAKTDLLVYFIKVWWDDHQNNRLFDAYIIEREELRELDVALFNEVEKRLVPQFSATSNLTNIEFDRAKVLQKLTSSAATTRIIILCEQIMDELFIRPVDS